MLKPKYIKRVSSTISKGTVTSQAVPVSSYQSDKKFAKILALKIVSFIECHGLEAETFLEEEDYSAVYRVDFNHNRVPISKDKEEVICLLANSITNELQQDAEFSVARADFVSLTYLQFFFKSEIDQIFFQINFSDYFKLMDDVK